MSPWQEVFAAKNLPQIATGPATLFMEVDVEAVMCLDEQDWTAVPVFGRRIPGRAYQARGCVYGVVVDANARVGVIQASGGFFLPGGLLLEGERPEQPLRRELQRQIPRETIVEFEIARAMEFVDSSGASEIEWRCTFFAALLLPTANPLADGDADHILTLLEPEEAAALLRRPSHRFAITQFDPRKHM